MSLTLSRGQEQAHDVLLSRLRAGERLTKLGGFAGTGKTTLGLTFVQRHREYFSFRGAAPTGKAAARQQEVTSMPSSTIHSLLWKGAAGVDPAGDLLFGEIMESHVTDQFGKSVDGKRRVLWIDEGSLIDLTLARQIMRGVPDDMLIVVSGDPFQHEPVRGNPGFGLAKPDAMLTEVHRQALESPITSLATWIRTEERVPQAEDYARFGVPYFTAPLPAICESVARRRGEDAAVVVRTHLARRTINRGVRHYLGLPPREAGPAVGEVLLLRRNSKHLGVFNGTMARVERCHRHTDDELASAYFVLQLEGVAAPAWLPERCWVDDDKLSFDESNEMFEELRAVRGINAALSLMEAAPGYAGTSYAFQGSEFNRVFVLDEGIWDPRGIYTSVTRAVEHLVVGRIKGWSAIRRRAREQAASTPQGLP